MVCGKILGVIYAICGIVTIVMLACVPLLLLVLLIDWLYAQCGAGGMLGLAVIAIGMGLLLTKE